MNDLTKEIGMVRDILGSTGKYAIDEYARWYYVDAISKIVFCLLFLVAIVIAVKVMLPIIIEWYHYYDKSKFVVFVIAIFLLSIIPVAMIMTTIPTLINPEGYAIHQLLKDISCK